MTVPEPTQANYALSVAKTEQGTKGAVSPKDAPSLWERFKSTISENMPFIVDGVKAIGGIAAAVVTRNPQIAMMAASSVGNMIMSNNAGPLHLTDRQREILAAHPGVTDEEEDYNLKYGRETPWTPMGIELCDFWPVMVEDSEDIYSLPIPKFNRFVPYPISLYPPDSDPTLMVYLRTIREGSLYLRLPTLTLLQLEDYTAAVQRCLDLFLKQKIHPTFAQFLEERQQDVKEQAILEFISALPAGGWKILSLEGIDAFRQYAVMIYGPKIFDTLDSELFQTRLKEVLALKASSSR